MKKLLLICSLTLLGFAPLSKACDWEERQVLYYDRCGRPVYSRIVYDDYPRYRSQYYPTRSVYVDRQYYARPSYYAPTYRTPRYYDRGSSFRIAFGF